MGPKKRLSQKSALNKSKHSITAVNTISSVTACKKKIREPQPQYSFYSSDSENEVTKAHKDLDRCSKILSDLMPKKEQAFPRCQSDKRKKSQVKSGREKNEGVEAVMVKDKYSGKQFNKVPVSDVVAPKIDFPGSIPAFNERLPCSTPDLKEYQHQTEKRLSPRSIMHSQSAPFLHSDSISHTEKHVDAKPNKIREESLQSPLSPDTFKVLADQYFKEKLLGGDSSGNSLLHEMEKFFQSKISNVTNKNPTKFVESRAPIEKPVRDTDFSVAASVQPVSVMGQHRTEQHAQSLRQPPASDLKYLESSDQFQQMHDTISRDLTEVFQGSVAHESMLSDHSYTESENKSNYVNSTFTSAAETQGLTETEDADTTICNEQIPMNPENNSSSKCRKDDMQSTKNCSEVRGQSHTLKYLIRELRAAVAYDGDSDVHRLICEIEESLACLSPVKTAINFQAVLERSIQPIRSENVQLRRRLKVLNQQLKEREKLERSGCDPAFELIHFQSQNSELQQQLRGEIDKFDKISNVLEVTEKTVEKLTAERQQLLMILNQKDTDHMKTRHDWVQDVTRVKKEVEVANGRLASLRHRLESADQENHLLKMSISQRDAELSQLQDLVQSCKGKICDDSMNTLPLTRVEAKTPQENLPSSGVLTQEALEEFNRSTGSSKKSIHSDNPKFKAADYFAPEQSPPRIDPSQSEQSPLREVVGIDKSNISPSARFKQTIIDLKQKAAKFEVEREAKVNSRAKSSASDSGTEVSCGRAESPGSQYSSKSGKIPFPNAQNPSIRFASPKPDVSQLSQTSSCRYSVTDYFRKYPVDRFNDFDVATVTDTTLDDDSILSDLTMTSVSTMRSSDDRSFRENLKSLDANISRIQQTLSKK